METLSTKFESIAGLFVYGLVMYGCVGSFFQPIV